MRFYIVMTMATVVGTIAAAIIVFLVLRLVTAVAPHAWAVAAALFHRAQAHGLAALIGYWAAWVLLFPAMLLICLVGGFRRLWRESRSPHPPYAHLMGTSAQSDTDDKSD